MDEIAKPTVNYHYEPLAGRWYFGVWDEGKLVKEFYVTDQEILVAPRGTTSIDIIKPHFEGLPQFDQLLDKLEALPFGAGRS